MRLPFLCSPLRTGHYIKADLVVDLRINQFGLHDNVATVATGAMSQTEDIVVIQSLGAWQLGRLGRGEVAKELEQRTTSRPQGQ